MSLSQSRSFQSGGVQYDLRVEHDGTQATLTGTADGVAIGGTHAVARRGDTLLFRTAAGLVPVTVARDRRGTWVTAQGRVWLLETPKPTAAGTAGSNSDTMAAPMTGRVLKILVKPGDPVAEGATVAVIEAMKMETKIAAPRDGIVATVHATEGSQIEQGEPVVSLEPAAPRAKD
jgi:3-methylcrotonyl-CoA carboxylase alpha subunit